MSDRRSALADLPGWPLLLDEATLARFVSMTRRAVRAAVARGTLPVPRLIGGHERWHIDEVRARLTDLYGLGQLTARPQADRVVLQEALDAYGFDGSNGPSRPTRQGGRTNL